MTKTLLAVVSCHTRPEFSDAIRNTWASEVPADKADLRFFLGRGPNAPKPDEVILDCDDSYAGLPEKVREIVRWAHKKQYSHVSKIDDDVVMDPVKFVRSGFQMFDYVGYRPDGADGYGIEGRSFEGAKGTWGFCYSLSRKSMDAIVGSPLPGEEGSAWDSSLGDQHLGNDEYWICRLLHLNKIYLHVDQRYHLRTGEATELQEVPGVFLFCVHMHGTMEKQEEVHEMCRIWRERLQND